MSTKQSRRKHLVLGMAVASIGLTSSQGWAQLLLYEPFQYTAGQALGGAGTTYPPVGQTNLGINSATWYARGTVGAYTTANDATIASSSLSYAGLAASQGNSVDYGKSTTGATPLYADALSLPQPISLTGTSNSVYYSFVVRINGLVSGARAPFISLSKDPSTAALAGSSLPNTGSGSATPQPAGIFMRPDGDASANYQLGVGKNNSDAIGPAAGAGSWQVHSPIGSFTANQTGATQNPNAGIPATYFIVAKYTFNDTVVFGGQKDTVSMYINPALSVMGENGLEASVPANSYYSATNAFGTATLDSDAIRSLILIGHRQNVDNSVAVSVDEIRVGTSYASVTPRSLTWDGDGASGSNPSNTSGSWEAAGNWYDGSSNRTWGFGEDATFGTGTGSGSATVTLGTAQAAGRVTFAAGSPTFTLAGSALTMNGYGGFVANQSANVSAPITLAGGQTWEAASGATLTTGNVSGTGTLFKTGAGVVVANHLRTTGLSVTDGTMRIAQNSLAAGVSKIGSVSVSGSGKFDITDNKLITSSPIGSHNGTNYTGVAGLVEAGRNSGFWNGNGITTSMSDATSGSNYTMLGVATGTEVVGIGPTDTAVWAGQTVTGSDTLVMYTYGGDANLSGFVDIDDYGLIDFNASTGGVLTGWYNGDFDYNGIQDIDDYGVIDFVINIQGAPFSTTGGISVSAIPEPTASCGLAILAASALTRRRRRN